MHCALSLHSRESLQGPGVQQAVRPAGPASEVTIFIKCPERETLFSCPAVLDNTLADLKLRFAKIRPIQDLEVIVFKKENLQDERSLKSYGIIKGATLSVRKVVAGARAAALIPEKPKCAESLKEKRQDVPSIADTVSMVGKVAVTSVQLLVKTPLGSTKTIDVRLTDTVTMLIEAVKNQCQVRDVWLSLRGKTLSEYDDHSLQQLGIQSGDTIQAMFRLRGGCFAWRA